MAQSKPRIRKALPTEAEQKAVGPETGTSKRKRLGGFIKNNPVTRLLSPVFRFIARLLNWLTPRYFVNAWRELHLVTWPSRRETIRLTFAVFVFAIVFGSLVAIVDKGLDEVFKKVILR